jgi:hypothetical protein
MKKTTAKQNKPPVDVKLASSETPWGKAQSAEDIAAGIIRYSTGSHGGYFLDRAANANVAHYAASPVLYMNSFDFQTDLAANGLEALEQVHRRHYRLITA